MIPIHISCNRWTAGCLLGFLLVSGMRAQNPSQNPRPVTDRELLQPDPADWLMWRRTLNSWGYSPLKQIDRSNVGRLQLVWTRGMGPGIQEATPLVRDGVMFLPNPSDYIQAIDAATGDLRWEYKRNLPEGSQQVSSRAQHQSQSGDLREPDHRHQRRRFSVRARHESRESWHGRRALSTIAKPPRRKRRVRSSPTARSFRRAAANTSSVRTAASSRRTTPRPARSCGGDEPSRSPANRATRAGAEFPTRSAGTWAHGWCPAMTRS